jgi:hypothetical protein
VLAPSQQIATTAKPKKTAKRKIDLKRRKKCGVCRKLFKTRGWYFKHMHKHEVTA